MAQDIFGEEHTGISISRAQNFASFDTHQAKISPQSLELFDGKN